MLENFTAQDMHEIAQRMATKRILEDGEITPHFAVIEGGGIRIIFTPWQREEDKPMMLNVLRLAFLLWEVKFYTLTSEVWIAQYKGDIKDKPDDWFPKDQPDRKEAVHVLTTTYDGVHTWAAEILRDENKKVSNLREMNSSYDKITGRMTSLLPPPGSKKVEPHNYNLIDGLINEGFRRYNMVVVDLEGFPM